jgi:peroxiredoxin
MLQAGDLAPDFELPVLIGGVKKRFRLSERRGKQNLVLAFYPLNWETVSSQQMVAYQVEREKFTACSAQVVGISVDSILNTTAWEREIGPFDYALCSDFWPHGEVSRMYGVLREAEPFNGASERAVFVVSKAGRIEFAKTYHLDEAPAVSETLSALQRL